VLGPDADTLRLGMTLLVALESLAADSTITLQLALAFGGVIVGVAVGIAGDRVLATERNRRTDARLDDIEEWKKTVDAEIVEVRTERRIQKDRDDRAAESTVRGSRPKGTK
jgi:hypothetical protein